MLIKHINEAISSKNNRQSFSFLCSTQILAFGRLKSNELKELSLSKDFMFSMTWTHCGAEMGYGSVAVISTINKSVINWNNIEDIAEKREANVY